MDLIKVYVAGPYTNGDVAVNVKNALSTANVLKNLNLGKRIIPFIPHLTHFWHLQYPDDGDYWLSWDMVWLKECDALFRIEGYSKGADQEEKFAIEQGIPRFYTLDDFKAWVKND